MLASILLGHLHRIALEHGAIAYLRPDHVLVDETGLPDAPSFVEVRTVSELRDLLGY